MIAGRNKEQHQSECDILSTYNLTEINWEENLLPFMGVLPIRVLSLKTQNPDLWQRVELLMDHNESMKEDEKFAWTSQVIEPIMNSGKRPDWSAEDILRVIGIVNTNGVNRKDKGYKIKSQSERQKERACNFAWCWNNAWTDWTKDDE